LLPFFSARDNRRIALAAGSSIGDNSLDLVARATQHIADRSNNRVSKLDRACSKWTQNWMMAGKARFRMVLVTDNDAGQGATRLS
jgi:hypothetical protein